RDRFGAERRRQDQAHQYARAQGATRRDGALRVWAVIAAVGAGFKPAPAKDDKEVHVMTRNNRSIRNALLAASILATAPAPAGEAGRILWRMDPRQERFPLSNRGAALWSNYVISTANYPARVIATDKDTGKVVWETNVADQPDVQLTAAPLVVKDRIIQGAAG